MSFKLYLGDVDPNGQLINRTVQMKSPEDFRSQIFFELLMNDSIVLSDSQLLTDPRLQMLLTNYTDIESSNPHNLPKLDGNKHKDFEKLINCGLIEVAIRKNGDHLHSLNEVWESLANSANAVPYVTYDNGAYARYLSSLDLNIKRYELTHLGERFRNNLLSGVQEKQAIIFEENDDTDRELLRLFSEKSVLQRDILNWITTRKENGYITRERLEELYDYTFGCYNVNISAELNHTYSDEGYNCMISTASRHIPIHLASGVGDMIDSASSFDFNKLRSVWAFDPNVLKLMSTDAFLEVRNTIEELYINGDMMMRFRTGTITNENWKEFEFFWEAFAGHLDVAVHSALKNDMINIDEDLKKVNKWLTSREKLVEIEKDTGKTIASEIVSLALSCFPPAQIAYDTLASAKDAMDKSLEIATCLSNIPIEAKLLEQRRALEKYITKDQIILTKY